MVASMTHKADPRIARTARLPATRIPAVPDPVHPGLVAKGAVPTRVCVEIILFDGVRIAERQKTETFRRIGNASYQ